MLNFLRNLRRTTTTGNQEMKGTRLTLPAGRYLKYAIGEIVLVVIGIMIAVNINNWNQEQKDRNLEADYYCRLLEDVNQDEVKMTEQILIIEGRKEGANAMLSMLLKPDILLDSLSTLILSSVQGNDYKIKVTSSAYDDIKSSGKLNILKDLALKKSIITYMDNMDGTLNNINTNNAALTGTRLFGHTDLISSGWIGMIGIKEGFDLNSTEMATMRSLVNFTPEIKLQLINDAIFYIGVNNRNLQHFAVVKAEIDKLKKQLKNKCKN